MADSVNQVVKVFRKLPFDNQCAFILMAIVFTALIVKSCCCRKNKAVPYDEVLVLPEHMSSNSTDQEIMNYVVEKNLRGTGMI